MVFARDSRSPEEIATEAAIKQELAADCNRRRRLAGTLNLEEGDGQRLADCITALFVQRRPKNHHKRPEMELEGRFVLTFYPKVIEHDPRVIVVPEGATMTKHGMLVALIEVNGLSLQLVKSSKQDGGAITISGPCTMGSERGHAVPYARTTARAYRAVHSMR